ncbi:S-adenosyl-L-methionine-dependent methyltransferase [Aspergillus heteromorphus CBS 117.55]|uniref:S-adenosyl-L-methionine-dependent methyltransferase n=1 Tax=Aspergillus heteromorphus CBS 117.55 TaxID=1448321 RepID=A0A317WYA5_9EURO|nr:S-adenosyl-L-methionine-dependent methyltransferase [Aspergillus heteromorphus CBS 117.55]PWY90247.1 S-adenosyl-L-methionine-dependent methyltransferase [Aspergillus heteromorphus CBS 117.55]
MPLYTAVDAVCINYQGRHRGELDRDPAASPPDFQISLRHPPYLLLIQGELFNASLVSPQRVLDLGTGTGSWAIDFAEKYPAAKVVGNDPSPIQHPRAPLNVEFLIDDFESDWVEQPDTYEFIHSRGLAGCVGDWHRLFRQAYTPLKPGGDTLSCRRARCGPGATTAACAGTRRWPSTRAGRSGARSTSSRTWRGGWGRTHGFEEVREATYLLPFLPWPTVHAYTKMSVGNPYYSCDV